jgi:protein tyrosine phosphatase
MSCSFITVPIIGGQGAPQLRYIAEQAPMKTAAVDTVKDFFQLIIEQKCTAVVCLVTYSELHPVGQASDKVRGGVLLSIGFQVKLP